MEDQIIEISRREFLLFILCVILCVHKKYRVGQRRCKSCHLIPMVFVGTPCGKYKDKIRYFSSTGYNNLPYFIFIFFEHKHMQRIQDTSYLVKIRETEIRNGIHVYDAGYTGQRDQKRIVLKDTGN